MKLVLLPSLTLALSVPAFADTGGENVVRCADASGDNTIEISLLTEGPSATYLAIVKYQGRTLGTPQPVQKSVNARGDVSWSAEGLDFTILGVQLHDLPANQARGHLTVESEKRVTLRCEKGPAYRK